MSKTRELIFKEEHLVRLREIISEQPSQFKVAEKLGVSPTHISKIVKGVANPGKMLLDKIFQEYSVNRDWFWQGTGDRYMFVSEEPHELQDVVCRIKSKWQSLSMGKRYELAAKIVRLLEDPEDS